MARLSEPPCREVREAANRSPQWVLRSFLDATDMILGIILGAGIAVVHGLAGLLIYWWAAQWPPARSIGIVMGGIAVRFFAAIAAVVLVITYAPVQVSTFVGTLFVVFAVMLIVDVWVVLRMSDEGVPTDESSR